MVIGRGSIFASGFKNAMAKSCKRVSDPITMHVLKDNVYHLFLERPTTRDYALSEGPWNFDDQLVILKPWTPEPPVHFDSPHFWYHIPDLSSMCYMLEIGRRLASFLVDSRILEIQNTKNNVGQFFRIQSLV